MIAKRSPSKSKQGERVTALQLIFSIFGLVILGKFASLQIVHHGFYAALAQDQHQLSEQLLPTRGQIVVHDQQSATGVYPLATNRTLHLLYAIPKQVTDPARTAKQLATLVPVPEADLFKRLNKPNDLYEPMAHYLTDDQQATIAALKIPGMYFSDENTRYYPEKNIGSHLLGFVGFDGTKKIGQYGLEGAYENTLAGQRGFIKAEKDAGGQLIATAAQFWQPATNGADLVLTVDRAVEYEACHRLDEAVKLHGADGGSVVILNPKTGAIIASCGSPDFDPNQYNAVKDAKAFLNPVTQQTYEPGSVMKALTLSAALDQGKITPEATYTDTGQVKIGNFTIMNSDKKAHGVQTMNQVLEQSLNTGAVFAMNQIGPHSFGQYMQAYGFGQPTGVELDEVTGTIKSLSADKDIYASTAAFGQGVTVTPLQLASAYLAVANGGKLMRPYIIERIKKSDGSEQITQPQMIRQVIKPETAAIISAMLVRAVRFGHGKRAGVPGYFVAGKTGTAQIPDPKSGGYLTNVTIGTFAGFAPVEDPKFVMVVKLDKPRDVQFAESSAAPLFGDIAKFLLAYYHVQPGDTSSTTTKP